MKTLYININNEQIQSNEELEVLNYDLDSDFFFYLGEKIAKGCKVENENALITDFNTQDNAEDYQKIIAQWNEIKAILFSEECKGAFKFTLPGGYIHWLRYHPQYVSIYDRNFSHSQPAIITIDLEELYKDSVGGLQGKILRKLERDDLYKGIDKIVFNDITIPNKSLIINSVREAYGIISILSLNEWLEQKREENNRLENERLERERLAQERQEQERLEEERLKQEQLRKCGNNIPQPYRSERYSWETDTFMAIVEADKKRLKERELKYEKERQDKVIEKSIERWRKKEEKKRRN